MSSGNFVFPIKNATVGAATEIGKIRAQRCKWKKSTQLTIAERNWSHLVKYISPVLQDLYVLYIALINVLLSQSLDHLQYFGILSSSLSLFLSLLLHLSPPRFHWHNHNSDEAVGFTVRGFASWQGHKISVLSKACRLALGPTHSPIQCVPEVFYPGVSGAQSSPYASM